MPDTAATIAAATAARHHLLFGRRGAGKTALLVEAKRRVEEQGALTLWVNMQPYRWTDQAVTTSALMQQLLELVEVYYREQARSAAGRRNRNPTPYDLRAGLAGERRR